MDKLIIKLTALGVPGIILVVAIDSTGLSGAAAVTAALAALGPLGMIGGIATLGLIGLITHAISEYGFEKVVEAVIKAQLKNKNKSQIINQIKRYPLSKGLKLKIISFVEGTDL